VANDNRGIGTMFGPDATQQFMQTNGLRLILRSHEGPDARDGRPGLASIQARPGVSSLVAHSVPAHIHLLLLHSSSVIGNQIQ